MIQTITTLALLVIGSAHATPPNDGDNAAAMTLICPALQLADGDMAIVPDTTPKIPDVTDLYTLNMTLAADEWQTKFTEQESNNKFKATEIPQSEKSADWKAKWKTWTDAALKLKDSEAKPAVLKRYNLQDASPAQLAAIRPTVAAYVDAIFELSKAAEAQQTGRLSDQEVKNKIRKAVYGGNEGYDNSMGGKEMRGGTAAGRDAVCQETAGTHNPVQTIATIVACTCGTRNTLRNIQPCGPKTGGNVEWEAGNMPQAAKWPLIRQACPVKSDNKLTAGRIENALKSAVQAIYAENNDLYIGKYDGAGCDGSNNGACIKYQGKATAGVRKLTSAEWIGELEAAAAELRRRETGDTATIQKATQIEQLKALTEASTTHVTAIITPTTPPGGSHPTKATSDTTVETREACNKHHGKNATCPTDKCTYDEKENKCNPKVAVERAAVPGTGEGAADKKEERCAGKPEKECRDGCKWEGESCKDSSLFVNKKLALMPCVFVSSVKF
uniref:Variant surface glycoprotein 1125.252 n=1 Tax=Trypanosoma brucei TaxID=5691 RepID=A0A1J0R5J9_9TRYP|nr:variant surface glycoprotein 1125.252 [Trypanosoma brucei]